MIIIYLAEITGNGEYWFRSRSSTVICANYRRQGRLLSLVLSSTALSTSTRRVSCSLSINIHLVSLTRSISFCPQTTSECLPLKSSITLSALPTALGQQMSKWKTFCKPSSRITHLYHYSMDWRSSILIFCYGKSTKSTLQIPWQLTRLVWSLFSQILCMIDASVTRIHLCFRRHDLQWFQSTYWSASLARIHIAHLYS